MRLLVDRQAAAAGRRRKQLPSLRLIICLVLITIKSGAPAAAQTTGTHCSMWDHRDRKEPGDTARKYKLTQ